MPVLEKIKQGKMVKGYQVPRVASLGRQQPCRHLEKGEGGSLLSAGKANAKAQRHSEGPVERRIESQGQRGVGQLCGVWRPSPV